MELNLHLEEQKHISEQSSLASRLQSDLKQQFKKYTDPGDLDHEFLFLVATMLDPRYKVLLNRTQAESAKANILKLLNQNGDGIIQQQALLFTKTLLKKIVSFPKGALPPN